MFDDKSKSVGERKRINVHDDNELRFWSKKFGVIGTGQARHLVMSAGQPINDELETRQVGLDSQAHCESAMKSVRATAGWGGKPESVGRIDQITTIPKTVSARSHEIKVDTSHRVLDSDDNQGVHVGLIVGALVASTGLTWFVISALPLPFAPTSGSGSGSSVSLDSSSRILDSKKEDRLPIRGTIIHGVDRRAPAQLPESSNPCP